MRIFERSVDGRRYRVAAQSIWDAQAGQPRSRQVVLGPADPPPTADLGATRVVGAQRVGNVGALLWVAEQLDLIGHIDRACGKTEAARGPSVGEMVLAVAIQRACEPGAKNELSDFLDSSLPRVSCLPARAFTGQRFHRLASRVADVQLDKAQLALAKAAIGRFHLSTDVLSFDTTNFDTHIATTTPGELARRGKAKSKRSDLRVVGLGVLVSEVGQVPLMHRVYPGNGSDQSVLTSCLEGLGKLHDVLVSEQNEAPGERTVVRDGGFWSPQLELSLTGAGYGSIISLPTTHGAAKKALEASAKRGAMKKLGGRLSDVRATRLRCAVGDLDRTLVVVESQTLLEGQKRGITAALTKTEKELAKLQKRASSGRIPRTELEARVKRLLAREHLAAFVIVDIQGEEPRPTLRWHVDARRRKRLETTVLGRRVLCTDRHLWSTERLVAAFRGQWNVEEVFRRSKGGGLVPWGPSHQWADSSLRLHTFATVIGLMLVALARLALATDAPAKSMMDELASIRATLVRVHTGKPGRPPTIQLAPEINKNQRTAVQLFDLARWLPALSSTMARRRVQSAPSTVSSGNPTALVRT